MDNISLLLNILFGGLTSGVAASLPPGRPLGIWGYMMGGIFGLLGGQLFLNLLRPGDYVGAIIAAMFAALAVLFLLRLAELSGFETTKIFARLSSKDVPRLNAPPNQQKSSVANFFNFLDDGSIPTKVGSSPSPKVARPQKVLRSDKANAISGKAFKEPANTSLHNAERGYDEDMFGQGINSLQGPSLFDTDDEVPNLDPPTADETDAPVEDKRSILDRALDRLTSSSASDDNSLIGSPDVSHPDAPPDATPAHLAFDEPFRKPELAQAATENVPGKLAFAKEKQEVNHADPLVEQAYVDDEETDDDIYRTQYRFRNFDTDTDTDEEKEAKIVDAANNGQEIEEIPFHAYSEVEVTPNGTAVNNRSPIVSAAEESSLDDGTQRSSELDHAADATAMESKPFVTNEYPDDLTEIKGIGKIYAQRLQEMGIYTWMQVAETEAPLLRDWVAATKNANVDEWPQLARALAIANDRTEASYSGPPPDDLTELFGITKKIEQRLNEIGIVSFTQLLNADPDQVVDKLNLTNVVSATVYDWQIQTKSKVG